MTILQLATTPDGAAAVAPSSKGGGEKHGGLAAARTVTKPFRAQLEALATTLRATAPHYIKTIRPNGARAPGGFSPTQVVSQLRCSGALEVVRIRREGFPTRMPFCRFVDAYEVLLRPIHVAKHHRGGDDDGAAEAEDGGGAMQEHVAAICARAELAPDAFRIGHTQVENDGSHNNDGSQRS